VARAAQLMGTTAVICMPTDAPSLKVAATRGYGADIVPYDRQRDDREAIARKLCDETGRILVPPYDDYEIMAGQGTAALELLQDVPSLDALLTPVGGGGLMAGCSTAAKGRSPGIQIFGVEAESANDTYLSFEQGERTPIAPPPTIADGIRNLVPGELTFPILRANVAEILLVSDDQIVETVRFLLFRAKMLVEPTGAVAAAALQAGKLPLDRGARVGVVLSGGNVDSALLVRIIQAD
jgi:threonine dehydratase